MATPEEFQAAVDRSRGLPSQSPKSLLALYSLYKQATTGDVEGKRPGALNVRGRAKYDAWADRKGMTQDDARDAYVALVDQLGGG